MAYTDVQLRQIIPDQLKVLTNELAGTKQFSVTFFPQKVHVLLGTEVWRTFDSMEETRMFLAGVISGVRLVLEDTPA